MEVAYRDAVKAYTKAGNINAAKDVQAELEKFLKGQLGPPDDAVQFRGKHYKAFDLAFSWEDARLHCLKLGGNLSEAHSQEDNDFLVAIASKAKLSSIWLGDTDQDHEGQWQWVSGRRSKFANWGPGQPNNKEGNEHFLVLVVDTTKTPYPHPYAGKWSDQSIHPTVSTQYVPRFICVWE